MAHFDSVLFDWMLTLAHYPTPAEHIALALDQLGRPAGNNEVNPIVAAISKAKQLPEVQEAEAIEDTSPDAHYRSEHLLYGRAGIDAELAASLYALLGQPSFHPCYTDVAEVLANLRADGIRIGVVSDIHVDLREHAARFGFGHLIEAWALSCELGIQKPDLRIFQAALDGLDADPSRTLMVGDRPSRDGAAAELGMTCLIVPRPTSASARRLHHVPRLVRDD